MQLRTIVLGNQKNVVTFKVVMGLLKELDINSVGLRVSSLEFSYLVTDNP